MSVSAHVTLVSAAKLIVATTMHSSASLPNRLSVPGGQGKHKKKVYMHDSSLTRLALPFFGSEHCSP